MKKVEQSETTNNHSKEDFEVVEVEVSEDFDWDKFDEENGLTRLA